MTFKKKKQPVTKNMWKIIRFLPTFLRKKIIRSQFEVSYDLSSDYVFKQAETVQEIEEALRIVHDSYTQLGYIDTRNEQLHFNAYLCLPTTTILIVKYKEEVIGTMSIVVDSPFGLPTETTWDLSKIRSKRKNIAEISSLSIKRSHKSSKGHVFLNLCKLMYDYCNKTLKLDGIVMAGTQEIESFYTDFLLFEKVVSRTGQEHKLVKGNKSTCCFLDLTATKQNFFNDYSHMPLNKNLYHFFEVYESPNIFLPENRISLNGLHIKKNAAMVEILEKFPTLAEIFSDTDKMKLCNLDPLSMMDKAMHFDNQSSRIFPRIILRNLSTVLYHAESSTVAEAQLIDVSNQGFGIKHTSELTGNKSDQYILIFVTNGEAISIHAQLQWTRAFDSGFLVLEKSRVDWLRYISKAFNEIDLPLESQRRVALKKVA